MAAVCFSPDKAEHANVLDGVAGAGTVRGGGHRSRGRGRTCALDYG